MGRALDAGTLAVRGITVRYGGVTALEDVDLDVAPGRVVGLIGPNGAGKTTLVNAMTGVVRPASGTIALGDARLEGRPPHRVARAGLARTYQNVRLFARLDVGDNVRAGAFRLRHALADADVVALLARAGVAERNLERRAGTLSYGEQRRLEIARALAGQPAIVLLDEPAAGMNPSETQALGTTIRDVARAGIGVVLIEHDMSLVAAVCDDVVVLNFGRTIARGTPREVARDAAVVEAYLG
ncbi:MAG: ABC transporter ATP-binding protein [Vulcanimicrobiaceae bacterium]